MQKNFICVSEFVLKKWLDLAPQLKNKHLLDIGTNGINSTDFYPNKIDKKYDIAVIERIN